MPTFPPPFQYFVDHTRQPTRLEGDDRFPLAWHHWSDAEPMAVLQAWASGRPLLVRGEAGCGKSQLARAVAAVLKVPLIAEVIHPRFEASDLLYKDDPIERLAQAQLIAAAGVPDSQQERRTEWVSEQLDPQRFVKEGPVWRAAQAPVPAHAEGDERWPRAVVLIDEIDKADSDVPNALLDVLGNRSFNVPSQDDPVKVGDTHAPLIVVTTNEDRELPPAFLRRCAVLNLRPEDKSEAQFIAWLTRRAAVHEEFSAWSEFLDNDDSPLNRAARQVWADRRAALDEGLASVGLAEYLDLLYSLSRLSEKSAEKAGELLDELARYALVKHREQDQQRDPAKPRLVAPGND